MCLVHAEHCVNAFEAQSTLYTSFEALPATHKHQRVTPFTVLVPSGVRPRLNLFFAVANCVKNIPVYLPETKCVLRHMPHRISMIDP